ncbi:MAG: hypothetical protein WEE64_10950 [Dehalococcoidia bacterium]
MRTVVAWTIIAALLTWLAAACGGGGDSNDARTATPATSQSIATPDDATIMRVAQELPGDVMVPCPNPDPTLDALTGGESSSACAAAMREVIASILLELNASHYAIGCVGTPPATGSVAADALGLEEADWRIEAPIEGSFFVVDVSRAASAAELFQRRELGADETFVCVVPAD